MGELIAIVFVLALFFFTGSSSMSLFGWLQQFSNESRRRKENEEKSRQQRTAERDVQLRRQQQRNLARSREQQAARKRLNEMGRNLQIAFQQLPSDPDAKRLRSWTQATQSLPLQFRRRQFARFRPLLLDQLSRWLEHSTIEDLAEDLRAIASGLGIAEFEAEYLLLNVEERQTTPPTNDAAEFDQQLREIHEHHLLRLETIRSIPDLSDDIRQELTEAEETRYRERLIGERR